MDQDQNLPLHPDIAAAINKIQGFITQTTGQAPTPKELSNALTRYFVLNEILGFIEMSRDTKESGPK